jgi:hypothetical protein
VIDGAARATNAGGPLSPSVRQASAIARLASPKGAGQAKAAAAGEATAAAAAPAAAPLPRMRFTGSAGLASAILAARTPLVQRLRSARAPGGE